VECLRRLKRLSNATAGFNNLSLNNAPLGFDEKDHEHCIFLLGLGKQFQLSKIEKLVKNDK